MLRRLELRIRALLRPAEVDDELRLHFEQLTDEFIARGMTEEDARIAAARQFGNRNFLRQQSRDLFSFGLAEDIARDLRYSVRRLRRTPLFFAGTAFVLALGIGVNCTIFNLVYSVLLHPLPYGRPSEIAMVHETMPGHGSAIKPAHTTSRVVAEWRSRAPGVFSDFAVMKTWQGNPEAWFDLTLSDRAERLRGALVTSNFFTVLGAQAAVGRVFTASDEADGHESLAVLGHGLWLRAYGGDPAIAGRTIHLIAGRGRGRGAKSFTVVGVLPPAFRFTYPLETEVWVLNPWRAVEKSHPNSIEYDGAVARLEPGVTTEAANVRYAAAPAGEPWRQRKWATRVQPIADHVAGAMRPSVLLVAGVALLLLLIACATATNALLVRLTERRREIAIRGALGASRARIARQLLTEGVVLSAIGAVAGALAAAALLPVFRAFVPAEIPRAGEMIADPLRLGIPAMFGALLTMLTMLVPALQGASPSAAAPLKVAGASAPGARWRFVLLAFQTSVAMTLLIGAALLLTSFWRLHGVDLGFDGKEVLTAEIRLIDPKYFAPKRMAQFQGELIERIRAIPGVTEAGLTSAVPFRGVDWTHSIQHPSGRGRLSANVRHVTPEYFPIMRLRLLSGRFLDARDKQGSERVAVISESFSRQAFPAEPAVGKLLDPEGSVRVVGVAGDVRYQGFDQAPQPAIYLARAQYPSELICIVARIATDRRVVAAAMQRVVHELDPTIPVMGMTTVDGILSDSTAGRSFYTGVVAAFAALGLVLTACGLAVVIARTVVERSRELAIRSALGASGGQLVNLVIKQGLRPIAAGIAFGLAGGWTGAKVLEQFLFEVRVGEPLVYAGVAAFLGIVGALSCLLPAKRVTRMAPAVTLRCD